MTSKSDCFAAKNGTLVHLWHTRLHSRAKSPVLSFMLQLIMDGVLEIPVDGVRCEEQSIEICHSSYVCQHSVVGCLVG